MIKFVGFDKDGTLLDSTYPNIKAWGEIIYQDFGINPKEAEYVFSVLLSNKPTMLQLKTVLERNGIDFPEEQLFEKANQIAIRMGEIVKAKLFPEVADVLKTLKETDYKLFVSSSHQEKTVRDDLTRTDILKYIDYHVGIRPGQLGFEKGEPHFRAVANYFGVDFNEFVKETVFVGDSEVDVKAANSCGITSVARINFEPKSLLEQAGARFVIPNLLSLPEILKSL